MPTVSVVLLMLLPVALAVGSRASKISCLVAVAVCVPDPADDVATLGPPGVSDSSKVPCLALRTKYGTPAVSPVGRLPEVVSSTGVLLASMWLAHVTTAGNALLIVTVVEGVTR